MKVDIINIEGKSTGRSIDLPDEVFGIEPNDHVMYLAVKQYNAHQRQGTHKAKERAEIAGSTRKIKRQKGTGTARAGSLKNPLFRGGGRVFGPRPRNYTIKLNKKVKRLARASALAQKLNQGQIKVLEDFTFDAPKSSALKDVLGNVSSGAKVLLVTGDYDKNVYLSGRSIPKARVMRAQDLNTYSIMDCSDLILTESSIDKITSSLMA